MPGCGLLPTFPGIAKATLTDLELLVMTQRNQNTNIPDVAPVIFLAWSGAMRSRSADQGPVRQASDGATTTRGAALCHDAPRRIRSQPCGCGAASQTNETAKNALRRGADSRPRSPPGHMAKEKSVRDVCPLPELAATPSPRPKSDVSDFGRFMSDRNRVNPISVGGRPIGRREGWGRAGVRGQERIERPKPLIPRCRAPLLAGQLAGPKGEGATRVATHSTIARRPSPTQGATRGGASPSRPWCRA
jgi:hypothetical protein